MPFDLASAQPVQNESDKVLGIGFDVMTAAPEVEEKPLMEKVGEVVGGFLKETGKGVVEAAVSAPQSLGGLIQMGGESLQSDELTWKDYINPFGGFGLDKITNAKLAEASEVDEKIAKFGKDMIEKNKEFIKTKMPGLSRENLKGYESWGRDIGAGGTTMVAAIGATVLTRNPNAVAALFGGYQAGDIYKEFREKGIPPEKSRRFAISAGMAEGALESIGLNFMLTKWSAKPLLDIAIRTASEAAQEFSQTVSENVLTQIGGAREHKGLSSFFDGAGRAAMIGAILGAPSAVMLTQAERADVIKPLRDLGIPKKEAKIITEKVITEMRKDADVQVADIVNEELGKIDKEIAPTEIKEKVKPIAADEITPEEAPLIEEAKKFKTVEEFVGGQDIFGQKDVAVTNRDIAITSLQFNKIQMEQAIVRIAKEGIKETTKEPIDVLFDIGSREYRVLDGHHRIVKAQKRGEANIEANIIYGESARQGRFTIDPESLKTKQQLIDIFNKAQVTPTTKKVSGLAKGVEAKAIKNKLVETLGDLPEFETVNMADQANKAQAIINENPALAKRIALGEEVPPADVLPESVFVAVENKAIEEGDVTTLRDLATASALTTQATVMGQRIRALAERNPESPVQAMQSVVKTREKKAIKKLKVKSTAKVVKSEVSDIKKEMKKTRATKQTWGEFIQEIQC